jgi:GT2 family glycosyltransferase
VDSDVAVHPDTLARILEHFEKEPSLDGLMGAYDDSPACGDFLSQYKNLQHCFVHRNARRQASTFWTGCGAIRRKVFLEHGGFDERFLAIEDIELGYRLHAAGCRIALDPQVQVQHLKRWTVWNWLRTDIFVRAIPWTQVILRYRRMPNDLNTQWRERLSVASVFLALGAWLLALLWGTVAPGAAGLVLFTSVLVMNRRFYGFLAEKKGWRFAVAAAPLHLFYFFYSGASFLAGCGLYAWRRLRERA